MLLQDTPEFGCHALNALSRVRHFDTAVQRFGNVEREPYKRFHVVLIRKGGLWRFRSAYPIGCAGRLLTGGRLRGHEYLFGHGVAPF